MKLLGAVLLLAAKALAHSGVIGIEVDGTMYPAWDPRIDHTPVKRIQWSYAPMRKYDQFGPLTNYKSPAITCGLNAKAPALKAVARAGAKVTVQWSDIVQMHLGPIITWMGEWPSPDTPVTKVKFFKIDAPTYDASTDKWANELAAAQGSKHSFQIPSDIKPGTYVVRTELLALHGNTLGGSVTGPEFYVGCFNVNVIGSGTASPEGATFPGAYKDGDVGLTFKPYFGRGSNPTQNAKYITPGPPLYKGKHDAPMGPPPTVKETGAPTGDLKVQYDKLKADVTKYNKQTIGAINRLWPGHKSLEDVGFGRAKYLEADWGQSSSQHDGVKARIDAFNVEVQKQQE